MRAPSEKLSIAGAVATVMLATDVVRLFAGVAILTFASWTDWQWRRAPTILWYLLAAVGAATLLTDLVSNPELLQQSFYLAFVPLFAGLMFVLYRVHLIAGGADMKALVALAILLPFPLELGAGFPLLESPMPGSFAALGNSLIAFLCVPFAFLALNLARRDWKLPHAFLGYRMPVDDAEKRHVWPMEVVENGEVKRILMPSRFIFEPEDFAAMREAGLTRIWITPKVPFMIPMLAGFVATFFLGDVLFSLLFRVLRPAGV